MKLIRLSSEDISLLENALPDVPRETLQSLLRYIDLIQVWNQRINLTGAKNPREFILHHVLDCGAALASLPNSQQWLDVGTGSGLPGLVWAILRPNFQILLVESLQKRAAFLLRAKAELKLVNVEVLAKRFETLDPGGLPALKPGSYSIVSRGTSSPQGLLKLARETALPWRHWVVFSNKKIHQEYLDISPSFGLEVESVPYRHFLRAGQTGLLTVIKRKNDHTLHDM